MAERKIKFVANVVTWFDRANGNTYHSVNIARTRDGAVICVPFSYGYGTMYEENALLAMAEAKWLPVKYRVRQGRHAYQRENGYPIMFTVRKGLKRDCVANGKAE